MPKFGKKKKKGEADDAPGLTSEFDFPSDEDEEESDEEVAEGIPGLEIRDEDGQEVLEEPMRYMAIVELPLRIRSELDSEQVGTLANGDVVLVTHTMMQGDRVRMRCTRGSPLPGKGAECGWVSANEGEEEENDNEGSLNLISQGCKNKCFTVTTEHATVRAGPTAKDKKAKFTLTEFMTFECLETKVEDIPGGSLKHTALQFKIGDLEGWTAEKSGKGAVRVQLCHTFISTDHLRDCL